MDSFPQELLEKVIGHLPEWDAASSSLVSRRWRYKSQQVYFESVRFFSPQWAAAWEANVPQDPDGIPSYVRHVEFHSVTKPSFEPAIFGRLLKSFKSMVSLTVDGAEIPLPEELTGPVSLGEFGKNVTRLVFANELYTPLSALVSFIFSFPNLKELVINKIALTSYDRPPIHPGASNRGPLELLVLWRTTTQEKTAFIQHQLTSRTLCLNPYREDAEELIRISSESLAALVLFDLNPMMPERDDRPPVFIPPLPSLTTVRVQLGSETPTILLARLLFSIHSAPNLCTVVFASRGAWVDIADFTPPGPWSVVDGWLANLVTVRAAAGGRMEVVIVQSTGYLSKHAVYFPEFRKAGGVIRRESYDSYVWDLMTTFGLL